MHIPRFSRVFILALFAADMLMFGGCSTGGGSGSAAPVSPVSTVALRDSNDSTALFGYSKKQNWFFTQPVTGGEFGNEISHGTWSLTYDTMTSFEVGGYYYIMGHRTTGYWFIQQILPSGDLGPETQAGSWEFYYQTLVSFQAGGNTYIFGQKKDTGYWFIQQINPDGKLGPETDSGHWDNFYDTLVAFQAGGNTYLFGQKTHTNYWFIQRVYSNGKLGSETQNGHMLFYYDTLVPFQAGGNTYLFGQKTHTNYWFIQQVHSNGKLGNETQNGHWEFFYDTVAPFQAGGNTYLFGQKSDTKYWFIQKVNGNGTMGAETQNGTMDFFYDHVFSFSFSSQYLGVHNWMSKNWSILQDKTLNQIIIPGSHDAGMSTTQHCEFASECNTKTQHNNIGQQLSDGARYFDVRPVLDWGGDTFYTGHFAIHAGSAMGCEGETLADVLTEVKTFVNSNPNEVVFLKFSHCYKLSHVADKTEECGNSSTTNAYVAQVKSALGPMMYKCADRKCLWTATLGQIRNSGANVVALFGDGDVSDPSKGVFNFNNDVAIYDNYADSNNLDTMMNDQLGKLMTPGNHYPNNLMYLLSWTLTMDTHDAENSGSGATKSITEMAEEAITTLIPKIWGMTSSGEITNSLLPNILYTDIVDQFSARLAILLNNYFYTDSVDVPAGEFSMGCNSAVDTECNSDEKPYHQVTLSDFAIDNNLVTAVEYQQCVNSGACTAPAPGDTCTYGVSGKEIYPVNCVTWSQAAAYCLWRGKHLPTEAQWEKAARGANGLKYPWGNAAPDCDHAVMSVTGCSNSGTLPIGSKTAGASPYGALDMAGNAWEWVADWYDAGYYNTSPTSDPQGPSTGTLRVARGGSFESTLTSQLRTSNRAEYDPASSNANTGFRCAK